MRDYYHKRKRVLVDLKTGRACVRCGFSDHRALEFHHRDPSAKSFKISEGAWKVSVEKLMAEVAKCDLLCSNCHRIEHYDHAVGIGKRNASRFKEDDAE